MSMMHLIKQSITPLVVRDCLKNETCTSVWDRIATTFTKVRVKGKSKYPRMIFSMNQMEHKIGANPPIHQRQESIWQFWSRALTTDIRLFFWGNFNQVNMYINTSTRHHTCNNNGAYNYLPTVHIIALKLTFNVLMKFTGYSVTWKWSKQLKTWSIKTDCLNNIKTI